MKKVYIILVLFCILGTGSAIAQGIRIDFVREKTIHYVNGKWEKRPDNWKKCDWYATINRGYNQTYNVNLYSRDGMLQARLTVMYDSETTNETRRMTSSNMSHYYTGGPAIKICTTNASLESLLSDVKNWSKNDASMYVVLGTMWKFFE